ncbi:MAG: phytanoyl-CoA dioxygenase family protein [Alphaproteobacteria bacterium]|nr:phytanoyl-CoA dioxygenase family protein [Alphaproteobacteria bacterium]
MMSLSERQVQHYQDLGYVSPVPVLSHDEVASYRARLEAIEARGASEAGYLRSKPHLLYTCFDELIRHPKILDAVEGVIGPNILCWSANFFTKEAKTTNFISWHQDLTYWGLDPADIVTAWVALSPATVESGCMRFVPGSHKMEIVPHRDTFAEDNMLSRGQEVQVEVDEDEAVDIVLQPGEMSLHHVKLIHGSFANHSDDRRIGFAIRYMPTHVRQIVGEKDSAVLVRGVDVEGNFEHEVPPSADLTKTSLAQYAAIMKRQEAVLFRGTGRGYA